MPKYRKDRIDGAVVRELSEIVREIKDPRVSDAFLTINSAHVSGDLKYATVFYSVLAECDENELKKGLVSSTPFMRRRLAEKLNLRLTPELSFKRDVGAKHGADIAAIIKGLHEKDQDSDISSSEDAGGGNDDE